MKRTLKKIIDYAVQVAQPERIFLFGSMADGSSNVYSDVDLLIIVEGHLQKMIIKERIASYASDLSLRTDVLVYSGAEFEMERQKPNSFVSAILKNSKIVYEFNIKK